MVEVLMQIGMSTSPQTAASYKTGCSSFHTLMAKEAHKQADSTCGHSHQATRTRMTRNHQHQDECTL